MGYIDGIYIYKQRYQQENLSWFGIIRIQGWNSRSKKIIGTADES